MIDKIATVGNMVHIREKFWTFIVADRATKLQTF